MSINTLTKIIIIVSFTYNFFKFAIGVGVFGILAFLVFAFELLLLLSLRKRNITVKKDMDKFSSSLVRRDEAHLYSELWEPPLAMFCNIRDKSGIRGKDYNYVHIIIRIVQGFISQERQKIIVCII